jgi:hypothetical protein
MADERKTRPLEVVLQDFRRLSTGAWIAIVVLLFLLILAIVGVFLSGTGDLAAGVSDAGMFAMALGVLFTLAVGGSLMALIFYSSRRGYDEPASRDLMGKHLNEDNKD